jgi:nitrogen regulatory protein PII
MKLVTVIATSELQERLIDDLRELGASGYTISTVSGGGLHGPRTRGVWDTGNVRIETLVPADVAAAVLERVVRGYEGLSLVAFMHEVDAVPREHFAKTLHQ